MTYLELLQALEDRIGYQHLPLNPRATSLKQIFECSPVHHDLMYRLVQALFKQNACCQLTDTVQRTACFDAIGPLRRDALKIESADVDVYRLLDDVCDALDKIFPADSIALTPTKADPTPSAEVIHLDNARRRKKN